MTSPDRETIEELAEEIWAQAEAGESRHDRLARGSKIRDAAPVIEAMIREGLVRRTGDRVVLSPAGEAMARSIVRRHRLAEILLTQVLSVQENLSESTACRMEHILSSEVTDSVCTFLGHPPHCPHGKPIPRGRCCEIFSRTISPLVLPLPELQVGESGRIVFMTPGTRRSLDRIANLGIVPGSSVRLLQKRPSVVLEVGETTVALDTEIASELYVRRLSGDGTA